MHRRRRPSFDKVGRAKKWRQWEEEEKSLRQLLRAALDCKPESEPLDASPPLRPGKKPKKRSQGSCPLSQEEAQRLQALLDRNSYRRKATGLSLGVQKAFAQNPASFGARLVGGKSVLSFRYPNDGTTFDGGVVEVTAHIHGENFISSDSSVTSGAAVSNVELHSSCVCGGKYDAIRSERSTIIATLASNTRFEKSKVIESHLSNCDVRRSTLINCRYTGKRIEGKFIIRNELVEPPMPGKQAEPEAQASGRG